MGNTLALIIISPTPPAIELLYLWTDEWKKANIPANVEFFKAIGVMFGVPKYS